MSSARHRSSTWHASLLPPRWVQVRSVSLNLRVKTNPRIGSCMGDLWAQRIGRKGGRGIQSALPYSPWRAGRCMWPVSASSPTVESYGCVAVAPISVARRCCCADVAFLLQCCTAGSVRRGRHKGALTHSLAPRHTRRGVHCYPVPCALGCVGCHVSASSQLPGAGCSPEC